MADDSFVGNPEMMSSSIEHIKRLIIAQRHMWVVDAIEGYNHLEEQSGGIIDISVVKSRTFSLFLELQSGLRRILSAKEFSLLERQMQSRDFRAIYAAFVTMDSFLDRTGLMEWGVIIPEADDLFAGVDDDLF